METMDELRDWRVKFTVQVTTRGFRDTSQALLVQRVKRDLLQLHEIECEVSESQRLAGLDIVAGCRSANEPAGWDYAAKVIKAVYELEALQHLEYRIRHIDLAESLTGSES